MNFFPILSEMLPQTSSVWEYSQVPAGSMHAGVFMLCLLCLGVVIALSFVVYCIKRPLYLEQWSDFLAERALPGRLVAAILLALIGFYLTASFAYVALFPDAELSANMLIFQTLVFHFPVLILVAVLLRRAKISGRESFGISWKKVPKLLGLSLLLYLGALPILWFYSLIYQIFLTQIGHEFYMQDVVQLLATDAEWPVRACLFFIAIVMAPVFEEVIFRGILLPYVIRRTGLWPAVILVSAGFAGLHFHIPSLVPLFLLSAIFCLAYIRTRSLIVPIGMHAAFNAVTVILVLLMDG